MKRYIRSSQVPNSYLYIFKHGIGPGTIPSDVQVVKTKDLPDGYTAVWLNRFLTYDELKQYDIPSETRINELLGRIGYCQKDGDAVPCDEVEACDINASIDTSFKGITDEEFAEVVDSYKKSGQGSRYTDWSLIVAELKGTYGLDTAKELADAICYGDKDVDACDKVTASTKPHPPIPAGWERVPEGDDDEGNWGTIFKELPNNGGYIWLDLSYDDNNRRYYELQIGYRNSDGTIGDIRPLISKEFYRLSDAVQYAEDRINRESDSDDIESCDTVESCDTKYFANMVNASSEDTYRYLIRGFYDSDRRGLADDSWADTVSEVDEIVNEYANKGYYIELRNLKTGTVLEFSADNWFDEIYPDGGFAEIGDI